MLVLTRKLQEQIRIGQDVVITVLEFRGNSIRIGIEAPQHVKIMRGELPRSKPDQAATASTSAASEEVSNTVVQVIELSQQAPRLTTEQRRPAQPIALNQRHPMPSGTDTRTVRQPLANKLALRREHQSSTDHSTSPDATEESAPNGDDGSARSHYSNMIEFELDLLGEDHLLADQAENANLMWNAV